MTDAIAHGHGTRHADATRRWRTRASSTRSALPQGLGLLFVLSALSYLVDYFHFEGMLRWSLILIFMLLKAGLIVAVFMHMAWERLALVYAILLPLFAVLVFVGIMVSESDYTFLTREAFFRLLQ